MPDVSPAVTGTSSGNNAPVPAGSNPSAGQLEGSPAPGQGQTVPPAKVAMSVEAVKAARRAKAESETAGTGTGTALGKPGDAPAPGTDGTAKGTEPGGSGTGTPDPAVTQFVGLRKEVEQHKKAYADAAPVIALGQKYQKAQEMAKAGKHYEAILELGIDFDKAAAQVMQIEPVGEPDPVVAEMKAKMDKLEADAKAKTDKEELDKAETLKEQGRVGVRKYVSDNKKDFPMLARNPAWVDRALRGADDAYPKAVEKLGRELDAKEKDELILTALREGEKYRIDQKKLYQDEQEQVQVQTQQPTFNAGMRGNVNGKPLQTGKMTIEQLKARRRAAQ